MTQDRREARQGKQPGTPSASLCGALVVEPAFVMENLCPRVRSEESRLGVDGNSAASAGLFLF
jgi:hypothetical protein